jgi:hypothetical protein
LQIGIRAWSYILYWRLNVANRAASGLKLQISALGLGVTYSIGKASRYDMGCKRMKVADRRIEAWSYILYWRGLALQIGLQADGVSL